PPVSPHSDAQNRKLSGEASIFVPNGVNYSNGDTFDLQAMRSTVPTITEEPDEPVEVFDEDNLVNLVVIITDRKEKPVVPALPLNGTKHDRDSEILLSQPVTWRFSDVT